MGRRHLLALVTLALSICGSVADVSATMMEAALVVEQPGLVLFVDGTDRGSHVRTFNLDWTVPANRLDFGFMSDSGFISIAMRPAGSASLFGSYTFTGGQLVDFALRDRHTGEVFAMSDPRNFATQYYFSEVDSSRSRNPVVTNPYYNALVLEWDLVAMGLEGHKPFGFTMTSSQHLFDGMQPAPVPLPGAALLFTSGMIALVGSKLRRAKG
jgi:hypothetical protein